MGGDALSAAGEAQTFLGGGFDADAGHVHAAGIRENLPHLGNMGCQLGTLTQNGGVDVADGISLCADACRYVAQQGDAVRTLIALIGIREMLTNIPRAAAPSSASITA